MMKTETHKKNLNKNVSENLEVKKNRISQVNMFCMILNIPLTNTANNYR